jgi:ABC-type sugar transport system substrate-binding protein
MRSMLLIGVLALGLAAVSRPAAAADVRMYVRHEVTSYATWRKAYDGFEATRRKMGVVAQAVYQSLDDPNDITITHDFASAAKARAFAGSEALKGAMAKAGVKGAPQIWFTTRAVK